MSQNYLCLFNHPQEFLIKPSNTKYNESITMLLYADVELNSQKKMKERSSNRYVVIHNISSQTPKELYEGNS